MKTGGGDTVIIRKRGWRRILADRLLALLMLALVLIVGLWIARRPIASEILHRQFEQRGVRATYQLERVGLRTQVVRNLAIGDPKNPDLVARYAQIQLRWALTGNVSVYRIVARGVRLKGKVVNGKVVWGDVSKMMPPPTNKPFALPNIVVDVADTSIGIQTPLGHLGFAVAGSGNLTRRIQGTARRRAARASILGRCRVSGHSCLHRRARDGPPAAGRRTARRPRFACPASNILMETPRFDLDSSFSESFTSFDGNARVIRSGS